jgi:hypothetical protein
MVRRWAAFAALALVAGLLLTSPARGVPGDDVDPKAVAAAQKAVLELAGKLGDKEMGEKAKKLATDHDIKLTMRGAFKPRSQGGVGVGAGAPPFGMKDGIELAIIDMAVKKDNPGKSVLEKNNADLIKLAEIVQTMAEINHFYKPKPAPKKNPKDWERFNDDMKAASKDLLEAIKARDQKRVTDAARKLNTSCTECHGVFRDS